MLAVLASAAPLQQAAAQWYVGGIVTDAIDRGPLACVRAVLLDASALPVAPVVRTATDGVFQFIAPDSGTYRVQFSIPFHEPLVAPDHRATRNPEDGRAYSVSFVPRPDQSGPFRPPAPGALEAEPWLRFRPPLEYPSSLRSWGMDGDVLMRFALDSAGRVVPGTVRTLRTTAEDFTASAREFIRRALYGPMREGGRPTCSLVQQPFAFRIVDDTRR